MREVWANVYCIWNPDEELIYIFGQLSNGCCHFLFFIKEEMKDTYCLLFLSVVCITFAVKVLPLNVQ
jgi:hypothetical protein